jgi:hypothetical protein
MAGSVPRIILIRIREAQKHPDPAPKHWLVSIQFGVLKVISDPDPQHCLPVSCCEYEKIIIFPR